MIYLASPYSHPDPEVREERFRAACRATVDLVERGMVVFSPIVQGHPLTQYGLRGDWEFWAKFSEEVMSHCDELCVLVIDGWIESIGLTAELEIAKRLGIKTSILVPPSASQD